MTNAEFAEKLGVDTTTASRLRNGHRRPSIGLLRKISEAFDLPLEDLVNAHTRGSTECGRYLRSHVFDPPKVKTAA